MNTKILKGRKILIVEDDISSRLYLNKILEKTGAELLNAGDGIEAVNTVRANPGIEIILMDIQLPVMDGFCAAAKIRELKNDMIIIAQTAYGLRSDRQRIAESGFSDYIVKPILQDVLMKKIVSLLPDSTTGTCDG